MTFVPYSKCGIRETYQEAAGGGIGSNAKIDESKEPGTGNDWGGVSRSCTVKDLDICEKKVKDLNELITKKDSYNTDLANNSAKACDVKIAQSQIDSNARIKLADDRMNEATTNAQVAEKKVSDLEAAVGRCESKRSEAEYKLQPYIDALDKESLRASKCLQEKNKFEAEFESMKTDYKSLQAKCSESTNLVPSLQEALKAARNQISELSTNYEQLKRKCVAQIGER